MAKQHDEHRPEDPKKKGKAAPHSKEEDIDEVVPVDEEEIVDDLDVLEEVEASDDEDRPPPGAAPKKPQPTKLGRTPQPTQLAKKSAQPTQLAKKSPQPTMLQTDDAEGKEPPKGGADEEDVLEVVEAEEPSTPPRKKPGTMPDLSLDKEEVIDVSEEDVLAAEPALGASTEGDLFAEEEILEAEAASAPGQTPPPKTPSPGAPADVDVLADEIVEAAEASGPGQDARADDLDFLTPADSGIDAIESEAPEDRTELLDKNELAAREQKQPSSKTDLDRTVSFEPEKEVPQDDSSSVDLGSEAVASERPSGVDALAEELESDVQLRDRKSAPKEADSDEDVDISVLTEADETPREAAATSDSDIFGDGKPKDGAAAKAAALDEEALSEAAEEEEPVSAKKRAVKAEEEEPLEEEEEEEEVVGKKGGAAVATKKPKYLRRWAGGFFLALLLVAGSIGGLWYFAPNLLDQGLEMLPASPNGQAAVVGHVKEYKKAKTDLAATQTQFSQVKGDLDTKNSELAKANEAAKVLNKQIAGLKDSEKAALAVQNLLIKKEVAPPATAMKDLPKFIDKAIAEKQEAEKFRTDVADTLDKAKILEKDKLDLPSFEKVVKELGDSKAIVAGVNKKLEDAKIKESGEKGVEELIASKKDIAGKLGAVDKALADAMVKDPGAKGIQELVSSRKKLEGERNDLDLAINQAYKALNITKPAGDPKKVLVSAIDTLRKKVESPLLVPLSHVASSLSGLGTGAGRLVEKGFNTLALVTEVNYYRLREPFIVTPAKRLDTWTALLQDRSFKNKKSLDAAVKDAEWVRTGDTRASLEAKAKALYVIALVERNQGKYTEAKKNLAVAVKESAGLKKTSWTEHAAEALKELTDSSAYYLPLAAALEAQGSLRGALAAIDTGLKVIPNDGRLLARRSLIRLEQARAEGKPSVEAQREIRGDAEAATKDPAAAADAYFALGQLEETLEQYPKAEQDYRKALKAHTGDPEDANRFRIALARLLLLNEGTPAVVTPVFPPAEKEEKKQEKKEKKAAEKKAIGSLRGTLSALFALGLTGVQAGDDDEETPEASARLKESIELAKELTKSTNPKTKGQGYMLLGQAYAKQGKRTEGLKLYVQGIELVYPGIASKDLEKMVREHPAFQTPDTLTRPNAFLAERQFGRGLHYYWSKDYPKAEEFFNAAIGFFKEDARYYYFLGLARLHQKGQLKRDAAFFALEQGARLEADNHPSSSEVNLSLERLQGELRRYVDGFRQKALLGTK